MALLKCEKGGEGLRSSEATATVQEYDGTCQFLPIGRGVLTEKEGETYLSVSLIHRDDLNKAALIGLPVEAD